MKDRLSLLIMCIASCCAACLAKDTPVSCEQLFAECLKNGDLSAAADRFVSTCNDVASLGADPNIVFTGNPYGPQVGSLNDLLASYVEWQFSDYGITPVKQQDLFPDSWEYHKLLGDVHCGTNAIRQRPAYKWWEFYQ